MEKIKHKIQVVCLELQVDDEDFFKSVDEITNEMKGFTNGFISVLVTNEELTVLNNAVKQAGVLDNIKNYSKQDISPFDTTRLLLGEYIASKSEYNCIELQIKDAIEIVKAMPECSLRNEIKNEILK